MKLLMERTTIKDFIFGWMESRGKHWDSHAFFTNRGSTGTVFHQLTHRNNEENMIYQQDIQSTSSNDKSLILVSPLHHAYT